MREHYNNIENALEELKRADHLIFVSLKYTRTVDVLKNIITRLLNCFDFLFVELIDDLKKRKIIDETPPSPALICTKLREIYQNDEMIINYINFYLTIRKINKGEFSREREYRRHVKMTAHMQGEEDIEINMDIILEYYKKTKEFFSFVKNKVENG